MQFVKRKILKPILPKIKKTDVELKLAIAASFMLLLLFVGMLFLKYFLVDESKKSLSCFWGSAVTAKQCRALAAPSDMAPVFKIFYNSGKSLQ